MGERWVCVGCGCDVEERECVKDGEHVRHVRKPPSGWAVLCGPLAPKGDEWHELVDAAEEVLASHQARHLPREVRERLRGALEAVEKVGADKDKAPDLVDQEADDATDCGRPAGSFTSVLHGIGRARLHLDHTLGNVENEVTVCETRGSLAPVRKMLELVRDGGRNLDAMLLATELAVQGILRKKGQ